MIELPLRRDPSAPLEVLCLGAHSDDIEIGCGGTVLRLIASYPAASFRWIVFSSPSDERRNEALAGAQRFLERAAAKRIAVERFRESFFPYAGEPLKEYFEQLKSGGPVPDVVFTHYRLDLHQDHKLVSDLTWNTFRSSLILEYEIPKWDGDLGTPNCFVPLTADIVERKVNTISDTFKSQSTKPWFGADTFRALMRLRGVEANSAFAEAFHARKLTLG
jgi:LmbE family N-acetylglucosaminyl deacetylase